MDQIIKAIQSKLSLVQALKKDGTDCFRLFREEEVGFDADFFKNENEQWFVFLYLNSEKYLKENWSAFRKTIEQQLGGEVVCIGGAIKTPQKSEPIAVLYQKEGTENFSYTKENGLQYLVHFKGVLNPGLFMDQRRNRILLKNKIIKSQFKTGLNLFSYTGAFSLMATSLGVEMLSVDFSKRYLTWEKENQEKNGTIEKSKRIAEDAVLFLEKKHKKKEKIYDFVIIDPPTFSRADGKVFKVSENLVKMSKMALDLIRNGGFVFASCNDEKWLKKDFEKEMTALSKQENVKVEFLKESEDFTTTKKIYGLKCVLLTKP